jgi:hypothetical protein
MDTDSVQIAELMSKNVARENRVRRQLELHKLLPLHRTNPLTKLKFSPIIGCDNQQFSGILVLSCNLIDKIPAGFIEIGAGFIEQQYIRLVKKSSGYTQSLLLSC